jgi:ABC-type multidrug transport system ATPase subunit
MAAAMIRATELVKRYGAVQAVDQLSFEVRSGETFALIGPNGAGKTTTLRMLLGLTRPDRGAIELGPDRLPPHDPRARQALGYVPQRVEFPAGRTVAEVLSFFAALRRLPEDAVERALERVGLKALAGRKAQELSGGYTQRLSLAQALLADPAVLVLDEPTASLDPEATWEFRSLVEQLHREGKTILLSSHLLSEVERVADRVLILVDGRAAALEPLNELRARQSRAGRLRITLEGPTAPALATLARAGLGVEGETPERITVAATNGQSLAALEALRGAGIAVKTFELERPTLEETFLSVVRGGRDA